MDKLREDILGLLGEDSRLGAPRIAKMLGADEKAVAAAIKDMEDSGVIIKYTVVTDDELAEELEIAKAFNAESLCLLSELIGECLILR